MRTLYLDCGMGAAGDMLTAALSELLPDQDAFFEKMNALGIPGVHFEKEKTQKCGITGTHSKVTVNGEEEESLDVHHYDHDHHHDHEDEEQCRAGFVCHGRASFQIIRSVRSRCHAWRTRLVPCGRCMRYHHPMGYRGAGLVSEEGTRNGKNLPRTSRWNLR